MTGRINDQIVLNVIEKGLSSLGENPKNAVWVCLEKDFHFDRHNAPEKLDEFQKALERVFGFASNFLDALMKNYLSEATGEDLSKYSSFAESVTDLFKKQRAEARIEDSSKSSILSSYEKVDIITATGSMDQTEETSSH